MQKQLAKLIHPNYHSKQHAMITSEIYKILGKIISYYKIYIFTRYTISNTPGLRKLPFQNQSQTHPASYSSFKPTLVVVETKKKQVPTFNIQVYFRTQLLKDL